MKSVKIMMIAFAAVAALCITPLFIAVDTDAVIIEEGSTGLSVDIDSLSNTNADKLFTASNKENLAKIALAEATGESTDGIDTYWTLSEVKVTDIKNFKEALGTKVTGDSIENVRGGGLECKVSFKATSKVSYTTLFDYVDGTQDLNEFLGGRSAPTGSTLDVEGTLKVYTYHNVSENYFKTKDKNICLEKSVTEDTKQYTFSGSIKYTVDPGGAEKVRNYEVETENSTETKTTVTYDYGKTDKNDVKGNTKVYVENLYNKYQMEGKFKYKTEDATDGGYSFSFDMKSAISPFATYSVAYAEDYWFSEDVPLTEYHYYGTGGNCLFSSAGDPELCDNLKMESFLKGLPNCTVSDSYSDVKSVADSTYTPVNVGSGNGIAPLVLYIVIGVMAIAIIALTVILLKKKKGPEQQE